jgi:hypothetical protein
MSSLRPELFGNHRDVAYAHIHERVGASVAFMLRNKQTGRTSYKGHVGGKVWTEAMLPFLLEANTLGPGDRPRSVFDLQDGDDLFVHARECTGHAHKGHGPVP